MKNFFHFSDIFQKKNFLNKNFEEFFDAPFQKAKKIMEGKKEKYEILKSKIEKTKKEISLARNENKRKELIKYLKNLEQITEISFQKYEKSQEKYEFLKPNFSQPLDTWEKTVTEQIPLDEQIKNIQKKIDDIIWSPVVTDAMIQQESNLQKELQNLKNKKSS